MGKLSYLITHCSRQIFLFSLILLLFGLPVIAKGSGDGLEDGLQRDLEQSKVLIIKVKEKKLRKSPVSQELRQLKATAENIKASHLLLEERFRLREEGMSGKALERHKAMWEGYKKSLTEYLGLIDSIPSDAAVSKSRIDQLQSLLEKILPKKKRPIFGSLPYKNLNYPAREPSAAPSIIPAYQGGSQDSTSDDIQSSEEAPLSAEIAALAQSLNWNPVLIYEYVKNSIETEWYWGCMKGAEDTLHQKSGNDCDQAALLVALLRASGYPARYVRGTIEFNPDLERVKNLVGIEEPEKIAEYFQKAGIPLKTVLDGATIQNIQIEHVWVEALVPYSNYRGAVIDDQGKTWLGLDTSIKNAGYIFKSSSDIVSEYSLTSVREDYLSSIQQETPLEYVRAGINEYLALNHPDKSYGDCLNARTMVPEIMQILPSSMQFKQIKVTNEYWEISDDLKHKVTFTANDPTGKELFSTSRDVLSLSNRKISIIFEPETVEDQEIIDSYAGIDNTPSYLIRLRPVLKIDDERIAVGTDGLLSGSHFDLKVSLTSPNGAEEITNSLITGNLSVIGVFSQKAIALASVPENKRNAERILFEEANLYLSRWNEAEDELASLMKLAIARPIPSIVVLGGVLEVTYLLDIPHETTWKGAYIDADMRAVEAVALTPDSDARRTTFMSLSSLEGSAQESRIFEDDFQVQSMSTAKLLALANAYSIPVITIDSTNMNTILPNLPFDQNIKDDIVASVSQNFTVRIPQSEIAYEDWTGIGYIKENSMTGEAGWMLSGSIAGGMTTWSVDRWPVYFAEHLSNFNSEPAIYDPAEAIFIQKVTATDLQMGTAGKPLGQALEVYVHTFSMKPVQNVPVTFTIKAGGGVLDNLYSSLTVTTDFRGTARVSLTPGQRTEDNPTEMWTEGKVHADQVGENIVDASLPSGTRIGVPFTAYAYPGNAVQLRKTYGDGVTSMILLSSGSVAVSLEDKYGNPISNATVTFTIGPASTGELCNKANQDTTPGELVKIDDPCVAGGATRAGCATGSASISEASAIQGAAAVVILGGIPSATYPITATAGGLTATFNHSTIAFGNCLGMDDPSVEFALYSTGWKDISGNNVYGGKVGTSIPVSANVYFIKEGNEIVEEPFAGCSPPSCPKIVGARTYSEDTSLEMTTVTFNNQAGTSEGNGRFTTNYVLQPGLNTIYVDANAGITVHRNWNSCGVCMSTGSTVFLSGTVSKTIQVYGVDVLLDPIPLILHDQWGFAAADTTMSYSISPLDYKALNAYLLIYKDGNVVSTVAVTNQGAGTATIARGFWFDKSSNYEAQLVLNYGTGMEIRGESRPIIVGQIQIYSEDGMFPMKGAVTDGVTKLMIKLTLDSQGQPTQKYDLALINSDQPELAIGKGTLLDAQGKPVDTLLINFDANGEAIVMYRVPETFVRFGAGQTIETQDGDLAQRQIQITLNGISIDSPEIALKRPPLVLIHGLWGDGRVKSANYTFKTFMSQFNAKNVFLVSSADYHETNASDLASNSLFVEEWIEDAIDKVKNAGFFATKIDIIAHSMGGLITREYCRNNSDLCSGKIHKFITIDTPHFGSELASLIIAANAQPASPCFQILPRMELTGKRVWQEGSNGAILESGLVDLSIGSSALQTLSQVPMPLAWNAIIGAAQTGYAYNGSLNKLWQLLLHFCNKVPDASFVAMTGGDPVFSTSNDRIVSVDSQIGASNQQNQNFFIGVDHITILEQSEAVSIINDILEK